MAEKKQVGLVQRVAGFIRDDIWGVLPEQFSSFTLKSSALLWGGALVAIAIYIGWWKRARVGLPVGDAPFVLAIIGVLIAAILLTPRLDQIFFRFAMRILTIVGFVVSTAIMTLTFYLAVTPLGWLLKALGKDPLGIRPEAAPAWHAHRHDTSRRRYYRMF
ncbi:hypothetical protein LLG95_07460 [bacterium]|nr:hypothetical protein [bacterium]